MINPFYYQQPNYQPQPQPSLPAQDERIWVQNETSAEAYLVAPNGFVRLWDASKPVFYEKRADATGRPYPMDAYEYSRKSPHTSALLTEPKESSSEDFRAEIEALTKRIEALENNKKGVKKDAKSNADDSDV